MAEAEAEEVIQFDPGQPRRIVAGTYIGNL